MNLTGRICPLFVCSMFCSMLAAQQAPAPPPPPAAPPRTLQVQPQAPEDDIDRMFSLGLYDWVPSGGPELRGGKLAVSPPSHNLTLPQKPSRAYGAILTFPTKGSSRLDISYLTINDRGNTLAPTDLSVFAGNIGKGEPLAMDYSLRQLKVSWNYLSFPNPPQAAKLRIKTLWELQFVQVYPKVVATVTSPNQPLTETQRIILPTVGLGLEYVASRNFRLEVHGSGMAFPHRAALGDAEGTAVFRVRRLEIFLGGKVFHFKTSPQKETFVQGTLWGPYGGLRWVFR